MDRGKGLRVRGLGVKGFRGEGFGGRCLGFRVMCLVHQRCYRFWGFGFKVFRVKGLAGKNRMGKKTERLIANWDDQGICSPGRQNMGYMGILS